MAGSNGERVVYKIVRTLVQIIQGRSRLLAEYCADKRLVVDIAVAREETNASGAGEYDREWGCGRRTLRSERP